MMIWPDMVNAGFEGFAGLVSIINIRQILKDKYVSGVSWMPVLFFTSWGFWNLFFYTHLNQWFSAGAGLLITSVNIWWLYLYWLYNIKRGKHET